MGKSINTRLGELETKVENLTPEGFDKLSERLSNIESSINSNVTAINELIAKGNEQQAQIESVANVVGGDATPNNPED